MAKLKFSIEIGHNVSARLQNVLPSEIKEIGIYYISNARDIEEICAEKKREPEYLIQIKGIFTLFCFSQAGFNPKSTNGYYQYGDYILKVEEGLKLTEEGIKCLKDTSKKEIKDAIVSLFNEVIYMED